MMMGKIEGNPVVRSRTLTKLALDWQDTSKKAANDD
jgi:hypothetical protein